MKLTLLITALLSWLQGSTQTPVETEIRQYLLTNFPDIRGGTFTVFTGGCSVFGRKDIEIELISQSEPDPDQKPKFLKGLALMVSAGVYSKVLSKYPEYDALTISRRTKRSTSKDWISFYLLDGQVVYPLDGKIKLVTTEQILKQDWQTASPELISGSAHVAAVATQIEQELIRLIKELSGRCSITECRTFRSGKAGVLISMDFGDQPDPDPAVARDLSSKIFAVAYHKVLSFNPAYDRVTVVQRTGKGKAFKMEFYIIGKEFYYFDPRGHLAKLDCKFGS